MGCQHGLQRNASDGTGIINKLFMRRAVLVRKLLATTDMSAIFNDDDHCHHVRARNANSNARDDVAGLPNVSITNYFRSGASPSWEILTCRTSVELVFISGKDEVGASSSTFTCH